MFEINIAENLLSSIKPHQFSVENFKNYILKLASINPKVQMQLFRFVDVLPVLKTNKQIKNYFFNYLKEADSSFALIQDVVFSNPFLDGILVTAIKASVKLMAKTFIVGSNTQEAMRGIDRLKRQGLTYTLDILGELSVSEKESLQYLQQYLGLIEKIPGASISVKLSALYPQVNPMDYSHRKEILKTRLRKIYSKAKELGCLINVDTEHYYDKELCYEIVKELLMEAEFINWADCGIVVQAYLTDSFNDLNDFISWAKDRGTTIKIRLVKGAYWDYEFAIAEQHGYSCPVYTEKELTDMNYEELIKILFDNRAHVKPAFASHNIRSLACVLGYAQEKNVPKEDFEIQMLYGMLDNAKERLASEGYNVRVYLPYGELIPGMSYLVRRLLENTANDSFLKQGLIDKVDAEYLLKAPKDKLQEKHKSSREELSNKNIFSNSENINFAYASNRNSLKEFISNYKLGKPELIIAGKAINKSQAEISECHAAIDYAKGVSRHWQEINIDTKISAIEACAKEIEQNKLEFIAILCKEAKKPWLDADAEVCELIDFLNYYSIQAKNLLSSNQLRSLTGEKNTGLYQAYGVAVVIAPWNFPLAIFGGMIVANLLAGNTVVAKPAEQTPFVAFKFTQILLKHLKKVSKHASKTLHLLLGNGETIGAELCKHKDTKLITFTGSYETGMLIYDQANKTRPIKKVVSEMGGKNAIIVDESADLDEAIPGIIYSAFAYAGQKCSACSRLIVHEKIYEDFLDRFKDACKHINIGSANEDFTLVPAVIDAQAFNKISSYIKYGKENHKILISDLEVTNSADSDFYVSPTIFYDVPVDSKLMQEEIFGPILAVTKAENIDHAFEIANNTNFALTGGIFSRNPNNIDQAKSKFEVGNLYINRSCTGAIVSRQAFGGHKNSSIGFKAGGPNYLLQLMQEKTITENTMRKGFSAD